jgi:hypothetical protein
MTDDEGPTLTYLEPDRYIEVFLHGLTVLPVNDVGLPCDTDKADLNVVAMMCLGVKMITSAALAAESGSVHDMLLWTLADATEALLVTAATGPDADVAHRWYRARAEYLACSLDAL